MSSDIGSVIGRIPYRMALAGGWIDQPFISKLNPTPPGSMVVVSIKPTMRFMDRAGMATGTRKIAAKLWNGKLPAHPPGELVEELYAAENKGAKEPSGSQDMVGLIFPGVSRLDYDANFKGGVFPKYIESYKGPEVANWLEKVLHILPVLQRPEGYNPLGEKNLDPQWVRRLGQSGKDCFDAIVKKKLPALGAAMNECMSCWEALLPQTVRHPTIKMDLLGLLRHYQQNYAGAMYSGCGGGYLYVLSEEPVPGAFQIQVRL
jgi:hypothetical protein